MDLTGAGVDKVKNVRHLRLDAWNYAGIKTAEQLDHLEKLDIVHYHDEDAPPDINLLNEMCNLRFRGAGARISVLKPTSVYTEPQWFVRMFSDSVNFMEPGFTPFKLNWKKLTCAEQHEMQRIFEGLSGISVPRNPPRHLLSS